MRVWLDGVARVRGRFAVCRLRGHHDVRRWATPPGNFVCARCGRVRRADGSTSPILWPGKA